MTQEAVASKAGVTRQMLTAIERRGFDPSVKLAKAIANILEFDWTEFFKEV